MTRPPMSGRCSWYAAPTRYGWSGTRTGGGRRGCRGRGGRSPLPGAVGDAHVARMRGPGGLRTRRQAGVARVAVMAVLLVLLSTCGSQPQWGERALQWIQARDDGAHRSIFDMLAFDAPDVVDEYLPGEIPPVQGRAGEAGFLAQWAGDALDEATMLGPAYVDVSGSAVAYRFTVSGIVMDELMLEEHRADGAVTRLMHPVSLKESETAVASGDVSSVPFLAGMRAARPLLDSYLVAWSGRDAHTVAALYATNATLVDSLLRVRVTGRDAIVSYAAQHGGARLRQDQIPRGGGPAIYGTWRVVFTGTYERHLTAYVSYTGDDGNRCPGGITASLQIEQGKIVAERRYHDVASMRRCVRRAELPDGWWTHAVIPAPIRDRVTGTVTAAGRRVEVHNGTAGAENLVRWAMERFPAARLTAPKVASVAFGVEAHRAECSGDTHGLTLPIGSSSRIYLCLSVGATATPGARGLILHELAHAWMFQNVDTSTQKQFVARMQLPTWDGTDVPWGQRGMEQAAELIAWGLSGEPLNSPDLADRSCTDLTDAFQLLTRVAPLQPPCRSGK
jgi:hypothetical protein